MTAAPVGPSRRVFKNSENVYLSQSSAIDIPLPRNSRSFTSFTSLTRKVKMDP